MTGNIPNLITATSLIALIALIFRNNNNNDKKVSRVYKRLDEVKKDNEQKYTSKDVCSVRHEQISSDLKEIKLDVKTILRNGNKKPN